MKYYYVQIDKTVSETKVGWGFSNTKTVVAFESKARAIKFVESRSFDFSCKLVTKKVARKFTQEFYGLASTEKVVFTTLANGIEKSIVLLNSVDDSNIRFA